MHVENALTLRDQDDALDRVRRPYGRPQSLYQFLRHTGGARIVVSFHAERDLDSHSAIVAHARGGSRYLTTVPTPDERVFSEQEVTDIIRRAVELTEAEPEPQYRSGVTGTELEAIAREVGISPDALRRAISEAGTPETKRGILHLTEEFGRVVEGELSPENFDVIVEGLKPLANAGQPHMAQVGRKLTVSTWTGVGQAKVDVQSRNGRTSLKVKSNALFQALMTLHPAFIGTLITMGALSEQGMGLLGAAIGVAVMSVGAGAFTWLTKLGHRKAEKLTDELRDRIANAISEQDSQAERTRVEQEQLLHQRIEG